MKKDGIKKDNIVILLGDYYGGSRTYEWKEEIAEFILTHYDQIKEVVEREE